MEPIVNGLADEIAGEVNVVRLKADTPAAMPLQERYGGRGHPFFAVIDEDGQLTERFFGPQPAEVLREAMTAVRL
jgi:thioredoxin-like negative regulator of GroEL